MKPSKIIVTCEHAGNNVPKAYSNLFTGKEAILNSHRGWDPGALKWARYISFKYNSPLFFTEISRLLVENNRSVGNPELFSEFTENHEMHQKNELLEQYYYPFRKQVFTTIEKWIDKGYHVVHLSVHSFTPVWNNEVRKTDIGILFDESRLTELRVAKIIKKRLKSVFPEYQIKFNDPYKGTDDGHTTFLRKHFQDSFYSGIEIEINQKWVCY